MSRRGNNWSYTEVIDLLDIWGEQKIQQLLQSSYRNMDTFQVIASEMAKRGHERTAQECRTKTKTMRRDYKKAKDSFCSGGEYISCPFYEQLDRIFAETDLLGPMPPIFPNTSLAKDTRMDVTLGPSPILLHNYVTFPSEERLSRVRKRQRKTRNDAVLELSRIADRRVHIVTDRILSSLNRYATADLQDRERDRADTAQIIAIMQRQTELLESLVQMQSPEPTSVSPAASWSARPHSAASPPSRPGVSRRTLVSRVNHRRRPQKYSS
ncbi:uncharacterized protein LOC121928148 isoform X2 [Sceloporus undulatus]|uniref:uncharacterized protein LOC121928148 isoform X2 n=1 Tax=Sceloporus undulatus TaxID=8520 RepID=UPI001C4C5E4D|nr:uncharacterized protein LOC121928148 isoform X2 [Sceloporus undulatus]